MSYVVRYRGGPKNRQIEQIPNLYNEMPAIKVAPLRAVWQSEDTDPSALAPLYKRGVYSRVYTPMKNGQYIYVWVEQ